MPSWGKRWMPLKGGLEALYELCKPYMYRSSRKAVMLRSKLKNQASKSKDTREIKRYNQQRNLVVLLHRIANIHILVTSIWRKSQNHSGMFANLILRTNIAKATRVLCCLKKKN